MSEPLPIVPATRPAEQDRNRLLRPYLLALTAVTGIVDAVSYLALGHVFVANMTGNVVFLGFALADRLSFSIPASLAAIAAFLAGALLGGRVGAAIGRHRGRLLAVVIYIEFGLVATALAIAIGLPSAGAGRYALIVLLAVAMGLQNATARRLAVPDLTTTVLTLTLTGLAADSTLAGGTGSQGWRRLAAAAAMFGGAGAGALLLTLSGVVAALAVSLLLLATTGAAITRYWTSSEAWTSAAGMAAH